MAAADVYCQPNTGPEPFGIVFVEALYAGLPVVTSGFGGAAEIVDQTCGVLTPPGNCKAVADALRSLILEPSRRGALRGRALAERKRSAIRGGRSAPSRRSFKPLWGPTRTEVSAPRPHNKSKRSLRVEFGEPDDGHPPGRRSASSVEPGHER